MIRLHDIRKNAASKPTAVALVDGENRITWEDFADRVARTVNALRDLVPPTRPIRAAFMSENRWELIVLMASCTTLGIPCVGMDFSAPAAATAAALEQLQPTILITSDRFAEQLGGCGWEPEHTVLAIRLDKADDGVDFTALTSAAPAVDPAPFDQPFEAFSFTSGTSGRPKMVIRRTSFEARRFADLVDQYAFDGTDVHLVTVPLYHTSGPGWARIFLTLGGRVVLGDHQDAGELIRLIHAESVSTTLMVPPVLSRVVSHPEAPSLRDARLHFVLTGGRHLNRWVIAKAWETLGPVLHMYYGTTETGVNTMVGPEQLYLAPNRAGQPMPGNSVVVLDPQDVPVPRGTRGRIAVASYQLMDSYASYEPDFLLLDVGGTTKRFLPTGDSGFIDQYGHLELTGRSDGVARTAPGKPLDVNIFGLEADLMDLPCVRDTAVLRVKNEQLGDVLVVPFVPVTKEREAGGRRAVEEACGRRVPCLPAYVVPVDAIPYSPTGKARGPLLLETVLPDLVAAHAAEETASKLAPA